MYFKTIALSFRYCNSAVLALGPLLLRSVRDLVCSLLKIEVVLESVIVAGVSFLFPNEQVVG